MNIAIIVPSLANKGPIVVCQNLAAGLVKLGNQVDILFFDDIFELKFPNCNVKSVRHANLSEYDVVHSHGFRPDLYLSFHRRHVHGRTISTMHNYIFEDLRYEYNIITALFFGSIWLLALRRFDKVAVFHQHMKTYFSKFIRLSKLCVAENGLHVEKDGVIPPSVIKSVLNFKGSHPLVISIGSLNKRKSFNDVIRLSNLAPEVRFLIVGNGDQRSLLAKSIELNCKFRNVLLLNAFENAKLLFQYADCNLITSKSEGLPLVFIEACSFSVPTLSTQLPFTEYLPISTPGTYFYSEDLLRSYKSLSWIIKNKDILKVKYSQLYESTFSQSSMAEKYLSFYNAD